MPRDERNLDVLDDDEDDDALETDEEASDEDDEEDEEIDSDLSDDSDSEDEDDQKPAAKSKVDRTQKRISDLQSKLDTVIAENNKLRKQVKGDGSDGKQRDPELERWMNEARVQARDRLFDSDQRFAKYKIDPAVITGDTPEEMKASAKAVLRLVSRIETEARNVALQEHGFSAPPKEGGSSGTKGRNFGTMDQKEFDRLVQEVMGG